MDDHQRLLAEALYALEDRWVRLDHDDARGRNAALNAVTFTLVTRSIIGALALDTAYSRLLTVSASTAPEFFQRMAADAQSELASRLARLAESPCRSPDQDRAADS